MTGFVVRRALQGFAIVFAVATLTFALIHIAPGEPFANLMADPRSTPQMREQFRHRFGLDRPVPEQYVRYLANVARGDLGESFAKRRPVRDVIADALPRSLLLMGTALVAGFALGIAIGAAQAARSGRRFDRLASRVTVTIAALPDFWIAIGMSLLFAYRLRWFPVGGIVTEPMHDYMTAFQRLADIAYHLTLPAGSLTLLIAAVVARHQRAAVLDVLPEDFVRTARAKGLGPRAVLMRHALRNALIPTITLAGLSLPALVGGAVFVESIFSWPGMGSVAVEGVLTRDTPVVMAVVLAASLFVVVGSALADVLTAVADPRLRRA